MIQRTSVYATIGPLHNWDLAILVGITAAILIALAMHYLGPKSR